MNPTTCLARETGRATNFPSQAYLTSHRGTDVSARAGAEVVRPSWRANFSLAVLTMPILIINQAFRETIRLLLQLIAQACLVIGCLFVPYARMQRVVATANHQHVQGVQLLYAVGSEHLLCGFTDYIAQSHASSLTLQFNMIMPYSSRDQATGPSRYEMRTSV